MASTLLTNAGIKVRSVIGHLSPLSQQMNVSVIVQSNYQNIQKLNKYSTTSSSNEKNSATSMGNGKSSSRSTDIKSIPDGEIKKSVFISQSNDIFTNLALEDWFYRHFDLTNHHVLMLWSNDPCVVIGRHQNPFDETNVSNLQKAGIALARRNSGGGTVYHDRGNLNMTFFTPRERYNRTYNLNIVTRALFREWGIKADISPRDDILINDKKVNTNKKNIYALKFQHIRITL